MERSSVYEEAIAVRLYQVGGASNYGVAEIP